MGLITTKTEGAAPATPSAGYVTLYNDGTGWKYKNDAGAVFTLSTGVTAEEVQDLVGAFFADSSTINVTYNDAGDIISADVVVGAINHDLLLNFVANEHIDHSAVSIATGAGLSGGGDITTTRTLVNTDRGSVAVTAHEAALDPHPQYLTPAEGNAAYQPVGSYQAADGDLTAIANLATTGFISRTATNTMTTRTLTPASTKIAIANGDGISGNPTVDVVENQVNHNNLINGGGSTHVDHAAVSIIAGTYMAGGGDITASRTINHANSAVTPATYGGVNAIPVLGVGATGHIDSASTVNPTAALLTGLPAGADTPILAADTLLAAIAKLQAQVDRLTADDANWQELVKTADTTVNSNITFTNITDLGVSVVAGSEYYLEYTLMFRTAATGTGFAVSLNTSDTAVGEGSLQVNMPIAADGTAALYTGTINAFGDAVISTGVQTAQPSWFICNMKGIFRCTTSGTLVPQFRSEVFGSNVNCGLGSTVLARRFV